ncbi:MAG: hypothetical protein CL949_15300 [Erythrobacter sp.]|nr:hypothetical protein [Erythrobacter sp.]
MDNAVLCFSGVSVRRTLLGEVDGALVLSVEAVEALHEIRGTGEEIHNQEVDMLSLILLTRYHVCDHELQRFGDDECGLRVRTQVGRTVHWPADATRHCHPASEKEAQNRIDSSVWDRMVLCMKRPSVAGELRGVQESKTCFARQIARIRAPFASLPHLYGISSLPQIFDMAVQ